MWHVHGIKEMHAGLWLENLEDRNKLEVIGVEGRIVLKWVLMNRTDNVIFLRFNYTVS